MPITLTVTADTSADLVSQLALLLAGASTGAVIKQEQPSDPKPPATRTATKKADKPVETAPVETTATTTDAVASDASAQSTTSGAADPEALRNATRALGGQYGAVAGATALQELFKEQGSANGKLSEVTDDKMPALNARLTDLLAAQA